ncbi:hypothetical protein AUI06_04250 [archaeon 13_2_20CM_2_52_21]|nr:MAG: hypothetical protein AUI06_04250 [archaeon 13_2_20CM_2_52_21]
MINPASTKATRTKITAESETLTTVAEIAANPTIAKRSIAPNNRLLDDLTGIWDILLRQDHRVRIEKSRLLFCPKKIPIPLNSHDKNTTVSSRTLRLTHELVV